MKKKIISLIATAILLCTMVGCGESNTPSSEDTSSTTETNIQEQETLANTVVEYDNMPLCGDEKIDVALKSICLLYTSPSPRDS